MRYSNAKVSATALRGTSVTAAAEVNTMADEYVVRSDSKNEPVSESVSASNDLSMVAVDLDPKPYENCIQWTPNRTEKLENVYAGMIVRKQRG